MSHSMPAPRTAPRSSRGEGTYPALDGLRIVAVTAVVGTHAAFWTGRYTQGVGRDVLSHLDIGVSIFFVISGFLISREWLIPDKQTGRMQRVTPYARRRVFRILPMYWLTVVIAFLAVPANHDLGATGFLRHFSLLQAYGDVDVAVGLTQTWSLCTELTFYALVPAIAWVIFRLARTPQHVPAVAALTAAVLALASFAWIAWYRHDHSAWLISAGYWLPTSLCLFMGGTLLAAVRVGIDDPSCRLRRVWLAIEKVGDSPGVCLVIAGCAFAISLTPVAGDPLDPEPTSAQALMRATLYLTTSVALVLPAVLGRGELFDALFGNRVMRYLGRISYSVFLLHLLVLTAVVNVLDQRLFTGSFAQTFLLIWTISVLLSAVAYRFIEAPAGKYGRKKDRRTSANNYIASSSTRRPSPAPRSDAEGAAQYGSGRR